jgi:hypothetical protein
MIGLRDNSSRAKLILSIFWVMLGTTLLNMASLAWQYYLLLDMQAHPENIDMPILQTSDTIRTGINIIHFVIVILSMIFFIMWFRRAYYNLHCLSWNYARHTEGWAAGAWFIPILNLVWPYQIMEDIWKGTQNAIRERLGEPQSAAIVGWWWALYLINNFFGYVTMIVGSDATGVDELITVTKVDFIGEIITIAAIIITIRMTQRTSFFERELLIHSETPTDSIFSDNYIPPVEGAEPKLEN